MDDTLSRQEIKRYLEIYTYEARFEAFKKKNGLTKKQTWDRLRDEIQVRAWADVYEGMQADLDYDRSEAEGL